jgi:hypothetical protein
VVDLRLYRIAFLPALPAIIVLLFSLQSLPGPLSPLVSPAAFSRATAANYAREIVARAPDRSPGSAGDDEAADLVTRAFGAVRGGEVSNQTFSSGGTDMRNVVLRLPGASDRIVALIAPRDTAGGPGATTSAAATGILMELASELGATSHGATLILASTDGSTAGDAGAKELADGYLDGGNVDGVVALAASGVPDPHGPYLLDTSDGPTRTGVQLERTAERALKDQASLSVQRPGTLSQLGRLAVPAGLGEQAPLIERGIDAVTLSGAGELPVPASEQSADSLSTSTIGAFGRTAFDTLLSLDSAAGGTEPSPGSYIEIGGNLIPGWAIEVLALTLILPALVAAVDAVARSSRGGHASEAISWAALRAVPLAAALGLFYLLALAGIVPRPEFPFDPGSITVGASEVVVVAVLAGVAFGVWRRLGGNRMPTELDPRAAASALGGLACLAVIAIWIANPFLALLAVPLAHVWILPAGPGRARNRIAVGFSAVLAFVPIAIAVASAAARLGLGLSLPWQGLVMVGDGGVTPLVAVAATGLIAWVGALPLACGSAPSQAWTDSLLRPDAPRPINPVERRNGPTGREQDYGKAPRRETEEVERADSTRPVPGRLQRGGGGDPPQDEPDQDSSSGDPAPRI